MPLVEYEREVFAECGAWKNFIDLEDSLSLDELMELYEASFKRQERLMKTIGAAMGATFEDDEEESFRPGVDSEGNRRIVLESGEDASRFNIGFGTISSE